MAIGTDGFGSIDMLSWEELTSMKIRELTQHGFPQAIVDIWEQEESEDLLPVQEEAIAQGLLDGQSMIIAAPTSSGKTFVGEIAAYKCAEQRKKVIYLAPHKAIVEEKYLDFTNKYQKYGIRVAASSADHHEFDDGIRRGEFDMAVFTYEKLGMLLVGSPDIASSCGLLIVDEVQMLSDPHRGGDLELLLTKLLTLSTRMQTLALSATVDSLDGFDRWLRAKPLVARQRPIELREGVYTPDGKFRFQEWNSKQVGEESFPQSLSTDVECMVDTLVCHLVNAGEQVLVFRKERALAANTARRLANLLDLALVEDALTSLRAMEATAAREQLTECLQKGTAFHNADLVTLERLLVEHHFRKGDIRVVCSTSTLAMGVNLPARTVIIADDKRWDRNEETGNWSEVPITVGEYRGMSGRAGRYRFRDEFGRSVLLASSQFRHDQYWRTYIKGCAGSIGSTLGERPIAQQVLDIVASRLGQNEDDVIMFMMKTYAGFRKWTSEKTREAIAQMIRDAILRCVDLDLMECTGSEKLAATALGKVCASCKISPETYVVLRKWLSNSLPVNWFTAIYIATHAAEMSRISFPMATNEWKSDVYLSELRRRHEDFEVPTKILASLGSKSQAQLGYDETKRLKMVLLAGEWIAGTEYTRLEKSFRIRAGQIRNACEHLAWIIDSASAAAPLLGRPRGDAVALGILADRLRFGLPAECLSIARLRVPGINRTELMNLLKHGYDSPDKILEADLSDFVGVISRTDAARLQERIQREIADTQRRQRREQVLRLQELGIDTSILNALYESTGTALEKVLCDVFVPPVCSLRFERIGRQREGEPDNLMYLTDGRVIAFSVTARENQKIAMKKAGEIIPGAARYRPCALVVIGRPDFHELAIKNAEDVVATGINYKLIPVSVLAEMYVRVFEGRLNEDLVVGILKDELGYLTSETLNRHEVREPKPNA